MLSRNLWTLTDSEETNEMSNGFDMREQNLLQIIAPLDKNHIPQPTPSRYGNGDTMSIGLDYDGMKLRVFVDAPYQLATLANILQGSPSVVLQAAFKGRIRDGLFRADLSTKADSVVPKPGVLAVSAHAILAGQITWINDKDPRHIRLGFRVRNPATKSITWRLGSVLLPGPVGPDRLYSYIQMAGNGLVFQDTEPCLEKWEMAVRAVPGAISIGSSERTRYQP
jgi:hypothetical protein